MTDIHISWKLTSNQNTWPSTTPIPFLHFQYNIMHKYWNIFKIFVFLYLFQVSFLYCFDEMWQLRKVSTPPSIFNDSVCHCFCNLHFQAFETRFENKDFIHLMLLVNNTFKPPKNLFYSITKIYKLKKEIIFFSVIHDKNPTI